MQPFEGPLDQTVAPIDYEGTPHRAGCPCEACVPYLHPEDASAPRKIGYLAGYGGAVWIEFKEEGERCICTTEPGWIGPLKIWKAKRYAKRHGITLAEPAALKREAERV